MSDPTTFAKSPDLAADYNEHKFLDLRKPLLAQVWNVGFLKDFYLEQVHRPRYYAGGGSAPLLGNFLEPLTVTAWWVVPMVWLPPIIYGTWLANRGLYSRKLTAEYWLVGYLIWPLLEYAVHRYLFHMDR